MEPDGEGPVQQVLTAPSSAAAVERLRAQGRLRVEVVRELFDVASRRAPSDPAAARRLLSLCRAVADELGAPDLVPASRYLEARMRLNEGQAEVAMGLIAEARQGWARLGRPLDAFRTELGRMHVLDDLGRHEEAAGAAQQLLDDLAAHAPGPDPGDQALMRWMRAAALENLGVALGLTGQHERALQAFATAEAIHTDGGEPADVARVRGNRGVELTALARPGEAIATLTSAAELFAGIDDQLSYAMCQSNAVGAELLLGHYAASLERYEQAHALLAGQEAWPELCRLQMRAVRAYLALNLVEEAEALIVDVGTRLGRLGLRHDLAMADWLGAAVRLRSGQLDLALEQADRSVDGARQVGDPPLEVRALLTRSEVLAARGDQEAAGRTAAAARALLRQGTWPTEELQVELHLAQLTAGDDDTQRHHIERASQLAAELDLPHLRYPVLVELGRFRRRTGRRAEALEALTDAVDVVEHLRWLIPDEMIRTSYLDHRTTAHAEAISVLTEGDDRDEHRLAYALAEASKARTLSDILAGGLSHGPSALGVDTAAPGPEEQVVEYHVAGEQLVAFVWSGAELVVVRNLAPVAQVAQLADEWDRHRRRRQLNNGVAHRHLGQLTAAAQGVMAALGRAVFGPILALLDPAVPDLMVVPHGPLHRVPFHALVVEGTPVGQRWDVTLAASHAVADQMMRRPPVARSGRSLVVGVPDDNAPAMVTEAQEVSRLLPGAELLLGPAATVDAVMASSPECDVIHLACHGVHRPTSPMFSSLRLADRRITARDVLSLELRRPLVVLSACESGRQSGPGHLDEAIGFARSFVAAGAEAVVVSLWMADDAVTGQLMAELYRHLGDGRRPAVALGLAQARVAQDHPHPADWAPFAIHGAVPRRRPGAAEPA